MNGSVAEQTLAGDRARRDREHFDRIAAGYARKDDAPSSRPARRQRLLQTLRVVCNEDLGDVLEIGCGAGFAAEYLHGRCRRYHGIDYSENLVAFAREHHTFAGVSFGVGDATTFRSDDRYDVVFMIGVLHHLDDAAGVLRRAAEVLRPGGALVVNEPQRSNPLVGLARRLRKRWDSSYADEQVEIGAEELVDRFARAGLEDIHAAPQGVFSTPFAEVPLPGRSVTPLLSRQACALDRLLERSAAGLVRRLTWNVIVAGRRPGGAQSADAS